MRVITREVRAKEAAKVWKASYYSTWNNVSDWSRIRRDLKGLREESTEDIYKELLALGNNPDPDDVDRIIGNDTYTKVPSCVECGCSPPSILLFHDKGSRCVAVCGMCLQSAMYLIEGDTNPNMEEAQV